MSTRSVTAGLITLAPLLGACAFLTDFPDVEARDGAGGAPSGGPGPTTGTSSDGGAGSTGTNGSAGGDPASSGSSGGGGDGGGATCDPCASCLEGEGTCPDPAGTPVSLRLDPPGADDSVWFNTIVDDVDGLGRLAVGHAFTMEGGTLERADGTPILEHTLGTGFVLDQEGELFAAAALCGDGDRSEVFFTAATAVGPSPANELVVVGGFQGASLHLHQGLPLEDQCDFPGDQEIAGGRGGSFTVPFIAWLGDEGALTDALAPSGSGIGYFADVVAIPAAGVERRVAAIGAFSESPIAGGAPALDVEGEIAVVIATPEETPQLITIQRRPCDAGGHAGSLSGLRTSIAADDAGHLWVAGTGCDPLIVPAADHSFLRRITPEDSPGPTLVLGDDDLEVSITDVAVAGELVIVSGTYTGMPAFAIPGVEEGLGDGFVAAFPASAWHDPGDPVWFRRIDAPEPVGGVEPALAMHDLAVAGDRILVAGSFVDDVAVGGVATCIGQDAVARRGVFAELDLDGELRWIRVEGFEAEVSGGEPTVVGTAITASGDDTLIGTRSQGELLLACGEARTDSNARATMRVLAAP